MLENEYKGTKYRIVHCKGAVESFNESIASVQAGNKRKSFIRGIVSQIMRLAEGQRLSNENFKVEGDLPARIGKQKRKKFKALKRIPIRAYCWLSEKHENTYFISHYVYKNYKKLKDSDTVRVGNNWLRIEENNDEC